jgi:hypothetical protein
MRNCYEILIGKSGGEGKRSLGRPRRGWRIPLKYLLRKQGVSLPTGLNWLRIGSTGGIFEQGNEVPGFIKSKEYFTS